MNTVYDKFLQLIMAFIVVEAILGGAGRLFVFKGLSLRMILYIIAVLFLFLTVVRERRLKAFYFDNKNIFVFLVMIFLMILALSGINGYFLHNNSLGEVIGDITGYVSFVLLFIYNFTIRDREDIKRIVNVVVVTIVLQAAIIIVIHYFIGFKFIDVESFNKTLQYLHIGAFTNLPAGAVRIFFKSSIYLQIGFTLLAYMYSSDEYKSSRKYIAISLVLVTYAAFLTYTRAFWLGAAVSFIFLIITGSVKKTGKIIAVSVAGFLIMTSISYVVYGDLRTIGSAIGRFGYLPQFSAKVTSQPGKKETSMEKIEDISANYRSELKHYMGENIKRSPVLGSGLGVIIKEIQTASRSEYMYLDILMEMGAVGLLMYLSIFAAVFIRWFKLRSESLDMNSKRRLDAMISALVGIMTTTALNPFLNNPIGITYLVILIAALNSYTKRGLHYNIYN
jgi:hypothetical protein